MTINDIEKTIHIKEFELYMVKNYIKYCLKPEVHSEWSVEISGKGTFNATNYD